MEIVWVVSIGWGGKKGGGSVPPKKKMPPIIRAVMGGSTLMSAITLQPCSRNQTYGKAWTCLEPS